MTFAVTVDALLEVVEEAAALGDELQEAAARVDPSVGLEVLGEAADAPGEEERSGPRASRCRSRARGTYQRAPGFFGMRGSVVTLCRATGRIVNRQVPGRGAQYRQGDSVNLRL